jgi:hypothetical protein
MALDTLALISELSEEEVAFLVNAVDTNLLMFQPHNDPMVISLIDRGFVTSEPDADLDHIILSLSETGKAVVQLVLDERECPPT